MDQNETLAALREQISALREIFALSITLFDRVDVEEIRCLVADAVPRLASCRTENIYLIEPDGPTPGHQPHQRDTRLNAFDRADDSIDRPARPLSWAYPLRAPSGNRGYLVVSADTPLNTDEQYLLQTLAEQAGAALNSAARYHGQRVASEKLQQGNIDLSTLNERLAHSVADLERRTRVHESLATICASGGGAPEIATALHELTGHAVVVEDRFGNTLGSAGDSWPATKTPTPGERTALLDRIRRTGGRPVRDRSRIFALAQPRDEVLGVLALVDPERRAGQFELFALEDAAVVLALELSHQRSLAEMELRLRGDFVDDLLTGTDDHSARTRSAPLGHDLHPPHQVLVVSWPGSDDVEKLARAVDRAITRITQTSPLLTRREGKVVVVTPARNGELPHDWTQLYELLTVMLPTFAGTIGVGCPYARPSGLPRSYIEALRAVGVRQASARPSGLIAFDDLGFYRMLGSEQSNPEVNDFIREWLGPLLDYDDTHHYDLVHTLWQYYECGGNYDDTARKLMVHRSTLRYRLRRIRELSGRDLNAVDARLNLHIATRTWRLLHGLD